MDRHNVKLSQLFEATMSLLQLAAVVSSVRIGLRECWIGAADFRGSGMPSPS
jgi:hypothetical protein